MHNFDKPTLQQLAEEVVVVSQLSMVALYCIEKLPHRPANISGRIFYPESAEGQSTHTYFEPWEDAFVTQVTREHDAVRFPEDLADSYKGVALLVGAKHIVPAIGMGFMAFVRLTAADEESRRWEARAASGDQGPPPGCLTWPVTSLLLVRRRGKGRGFAVEAGGGGPAPGIDPPPRRPDIIPPP